MIKYLIFILQSFALVDSKEHSCTGIIYDHICHEREVIMSDLGKPINLVFHPGSNLLFFSHTVKNDTNLDFNIMLCHIIRKKCKYIPEVFGGYAVAHDQVNDVIYFGGEDGIHKYNFMKKSAEFYAEEGKSIWSLYIEQQFYYIRFPSQRLYVYDQGIFTPVEESINFEIDHFFISEKRELFFSNKTALYRVDPHDRHIYVLSASIYVRQITEDRVGTVYFCAKSGIYQEYKIMRIKKLIDLDNAYGLAFDGHNNVIYSDESNIYKLVAKGI